MSGDLKAKIAGGGLVALLLVAGVNAWVESGRGGLPAR